MAHKKGTAALTTPPGQGFLMMFSPIRTARRSAAARHQGFTLVELMVVVAIIAIVAFFALPAYQEQMRKSRRSEAKATLAEAAARMEHYYQNNKHYNITDVTALGYSTNPYTTPNGYYQISLVAASASNTTYKLQATAQAKGGQNQDNKGTDCTNLWLDHLGQKTPTKCW